ncbi:MAG: DUF4870 domain-containing protein [Vicinamibacteria bacterium]
MTRRRRRGLAVALAALTLLLAAGRLPAQPPPPGSAPAPPADQAADLVNALLGTLLGGENVDGATLQKEVEEAGGVRFKRDVEVAFLSRADLSSYVRELFDDEYPPSAARDDERLLEAFDLLPRGTDLRALRAKVLEDNVAGFYDERPDKRRLYAVSEDRRFTAMNQIVLAHELRHALQDQYAALHDELPESVGDFDDRRMAFLSLLEGDATLVMERFVRQRLGGLAAGAAEASGGSDGGMASLAGAGLADVPGAPPIVRDQLVQPYMAGIAFARALWQRGGPDALRDAWGRPPASMEQVLHPDRFFAGEAPRLVSPGLSAPAGFRVVSQGILGELFLRTLLGDGGEAAAEGWGGDGWTLWEADGRTALSWRSEWDSPRDADEFWAALRARFVRLHGPASARQGWDVFAPAGGRAFALKREADSVSLASADRSALLDELIDGRSRRASGLWSNLLGNPLDFGGPATTVPSAEPGAGRAPGGPDEGGSMATSTPGGTGGTNLGMAPNTAGLLCYAPCCIGLIFSIVAAIVEKQSRFVRFHAFQSLLLHGAALVVGIGLNVLQAVLGFSGLGAIGLLLSLVGLVVGLGMLALTIYMMIKANAGEEIQLPVIGPMAKGWV